VLTECPLSSCFQCTGDSEVPENFTFLLTFSLLEFTFYMCFHNAYSEIWFHCIHVCETSYINFYFMYAWHSLILCEIDLEDFLSIVCKARAYSYLNKTSFWMCLSTTSTNMPIIKKSQFCKNTVTIICIRPVISPIIVLCITHRSCYAFCIHCMVLKSSALLCLFVYVGSLNLKFFRIQTCLLTKIKFSSYCLLVNSPHCKSPFFWFTIGRSVFSLLYL
jgi:hypothetical protein